MLGLVPLTLFSFPIGLAIAQNYQLHPAVGSGLVNATVTCQTAFSANVTCVSSIGQLYVNPFYDPGDAGLAALCTSACLTSLERQRTRVRGACQAAQYYDEYEDTYWLPQYPDEFILYAYSMACLKRSTGEFCTSYLRNLKTAADCDECIIKSFQLEVNSPFGVDQGVRENYASLTSSCQATGFPTTVATSLLISTPTPTATCSGTNYQIQPTDTFRSVSQKQSVSTDQLLSSNGLPYNETSFPRSGSLCISHKCKIYVLKENDTCNSVADEASISTVRLRAWNPNINELCSNLARFVGDSFCISNPYGDFSIPDNSVATPVETPASLPTDLGDGLAPNVTSRCGKYYKIDVGDDCSTVSLKFSLAAKDLVFLNPMLNSNCTNLWFNYTYCVQAVGDINTYPGYGAGPTATLPPFTAGPKTSLPWVDPAPTPAPGNIVIPLANDTRVDCYNYMWINGTNGESLDCWDIADSAGLQRTQFALWNPSIEKNAADVDEPKYDYACSLKTSVSYCMGVAKPTPYWEAASTAAKLPSPRAAGEIEGCLSWLHVTTAQSCAVMINNFDLLMSEFYQMNPSVNTDCSGLSLGTYYCVRTADIPDFGDFEGTITPSPTSTKPPTGSGTPSPIQTGMVSGCVKFYQVVANDGCWSIANANSISLDDFYSWNPAIGTDCRSLQPKYYVCVGRTSTTSSVSMSTGLAPICSFNLSKGQYDCPPATAATTTPKVTSTPKPTTTKPAAPGPTQAGIPANCNKYVMQKDGVYCYDMAVAAGITLDRLYALNPALNGDCGGLWPGYAYCIGTS